MDANLEAGLNKRSFALPFHGGMIWCEHLDSMGGMETAVIEKFTADAAVFLRPSSPAFMIINVDETRITDAILSCIRLTFAGSDKRFMKIAVVGADCLRQPRIRETLAPSGAVIAFLKDYEKAKERMF